MKMNKNPHSVPEDYFNNLEERLFARIDSEKFPKDSGFVIPPGYFGNFENHLNHKLKSEKPKVISLKHYYLIASSVAAVFIAIFLIFNKSEEAQDVPTFSSAIDNYIDEGNIRMDLFELAEYIDNNNMPLQGLDAMRINDTILEKFLIEESNEHFWTTAYVGD